MEITTFRLTTVYLLYYLRVFKLDNKFKKIKINLRLHIGFKSLEHEWFYFLVIIFV